MDDRGDPPGRSDLLRPEDVADQLPTRPVLTSPAVEPQGMVLQRYRHPPSTIDVPGLRDALLVVHLAGSVLVEETRQDGRTERRWTGPGQVTLTPAGQPIRRVLKGRPDVALLYLAPKFIASVAQEAYGLDADRLELVPGLGRPDETVERLVRLMLVEAERPGTGTALMMQSLTRAICVQLLRAHSNLAPQLPASPPSLPTRACIASSSRCGPGWMRTFRSTALPKRAG